MQDGDSTDRHGAGPVLGNRAGVPLDRPRLATQTAIDMASEPVSRRAAVKLMGASVALAMGVSGCKRKPARTIVSRPSGPEYQIPGNRLEYASTWTEGSTPYGMIVHAVDGRPIKIEGNPDHPLNRGAAGAPVQGAILSLYDPDRLAAPRKAGHEITWDEADAEIVAALQSARSVVLMTSATLGPAERALVGTFRRVCPIATHCVYESVHDGPRRAVWREIFGGDGEAIPKFDAARVILSIGSDFLGTDGAVLENVRGYAAGRKLPRANGDTAPPARLYVAEGALTVTGANADHRIPLRPSAAAELCRALRAALAGDMARLGSFGRAHGVAESLLEALVRDLGAAKGHALVVAGPQLPRPVHALVALLNASLKAFDATLAWNPARTAPLPITPIDEIKRQLAGGVDVLICLGVNPVYAWPDQDFGSFIEKAQLSIGHALVADETVSTTTLALPSSHNLESWSDAAPRPGVDSLCQPVIAPLNNSRQEAESLWVWTRALAGTDSAPVFKECKDWHDFVRREWLARVAPDSADPPAVWESHLQRGVATRADAVAWPQLNRAAAAEAAEAVVGQPAGGLELLLLPHPALHDGRFANNGWLQELPDPISSLVWDNALVMNPQTAGDLGLREGDLVTVRSGSVAVRLPAAVQSGVAAGTVVATMGHGRTKAGRVGTGHGTNVAPLLGWGPTPFFLPDVQVAAAGGRYPLVRTQRHVSMEGRPIVLDGTFAQYAEDPEFIQAKRHKPVAPSLYPGHDYTSGHKWGLAIDLNACVGCSGCVVACQAENNIPVVGKEECGLGREMQWLRIDRYFEGDPDNPTVYYEPMLCQHCDDAPCENVCPVNATVHNHEGINEMVYNRCVGTRYCANNCPWKVRRFNFFDYQQRQLVSADQELQFNPQVTVRSRGVMEKCTFCIQRINEAKFKAANDGEKLAPDAITTACQQACPAAAIVFGDLNDPKSRVATTIGSGRTFLVLEELGAKPNVTYLARIRNPHPEA